jgi:hypothetical protein
MRAGNDHQMAQAIKVMTDARRSLYRILAEDDVPEKGGDGASEGAGGEGADEAPAED